MPDQAEIYVTLLKGEDDETHLKLHLPGDGWTYDQAKMAKRVSEGMTPTAIEAGLLEGDPDAWMAVLRVSFMAAEMEFPPRIAGENLMELMTQLADATREALRRRPPTNQNGSDSSASEAPEKSAPVTPSSEQLES